MTVSFHALWMLCALGGVVFAASAARRVPALVAMTIGFVAAAALTGPLHLPDPSWVGVATAAAAALHLFRPHYRIVTAAWGGVLGGLLTAMLEVQTLHPAAAIVASISGLGTSVWLARSRSAFAPEVLRDEALVGICLLALIVAMLPGVVDGWQAAGNLTMTPAAGSGAMAIPQWTLALVGSSVALGALYSLWSRR